MHTLRFRVLFPSSAQKRRLLRFGVSRLYTQTVKAHSIQDLFGSCRIAITALRKPFRAVGYLRLLNCASKPNQPVLPID